MPRKSIVASSAPELLRFSEIRKTNLQDSRIKLINEIFDMWDLDGDNKKEYLVCTTLEYAEGEIGDGKPEASSDIMLFDSNYSKVAELVSIPDGFWDSIRKTDDNKRLLKLEDVTYADIDNDGIMEIIIETPVWEGRAVNVYKYKNGEIYGPTDYQINLQP